VNRYSPAPIASEASAPAVEPIVAVASEPIRLSIGARIVMAFGGALLLTLLGIAAWLTPSPDGFGTHRQLKLPLLGTDPGGTLPACSFKEIFGRHCPSCGMTTSWAWLMKGNVPASIRANVAGTMLATCALLLGPWMFVSALIGRCWIGAPSDRTILVVGLSVIGITLTHWIYRLLAG